MSEKDVDVDRVLNFLNELVALDADAIGRLITTHVQCNKDLADHPTVQVSEDKNGIPSVGLLGVINGLLGTQPDDAARPGWGYIAAQFGDYGYGPLLGFVRIDQRSESDDNH